MFRHISWSWLVLIVLANVAWSQDKAKEKPYLVLDAGRVIALDHQAQRLAREALFLLVFGQTAAIKAAQLHRLYDESHG